MSEIPIPQIESVVRHCLPRTEGTIDIQPITTGLFNTSFFIKTTDGEWVLRIAPPEDSEFCFYERGMMRQEPLIHQLVSEKTSTPIAGIIKYDDSLDLIDREYILMERLPGKPMSDAAEINEDKVLRQMGRYLAQVHSITSDEYGYTGVHGPMEPQAKWADAFKIMWDKLVEDIVRVGHYDASESRLLRDLLYRCLKHFDRPVQSSLLHMDFWQQNILVDENSVITGVLDWDRALWGDVEIEFAVLDYCGISQPAFWEGYGRQRDRSEGSRIRGVFYFIYELQKYIVIRQGRHNDREGALNYKQQVMQFLQQCFGSIKA